MAWNAMYPRHPTYIVPKFKRFRNPKDIVPKRNPTIFLAPKLGHLTHRNLIHYIDEISMRKKDCSVPKNAINNKYFKTQTVIII